MHGLDDALRPELLGLAHDGLALNEAVPVMGDDGVAHVKDLVQGAGRDVERAGREPDDGRRRRSVGHGVAVTLHDAARRPYHDVVDVARLDVVDDARLDDTRLDARLDVEDGVVVVLLLHGLGVVLLAVGTAARRLDALRATALRGTLLDDDAALGAARRRLDAVSVERVLLLVAPAALLGVGAFHLDVGALHVDAMRVGIGAAILGAAASSAISAACLNDGLLLAIVSGLMAARRRSDVLDDDWHVVVVRRRHVLDDGLVVVVAHRRHDALHVARLRLGLDERRWHIVDFRIAPPSQVQRDGRSIEPPRRVGRHHDAPRRRLRLRRRFDAPELLALDLGRQQR
mmetsp:Transcript_8367/g.23676  ORF Transcript_8367/g.23676 Transcript_8367/m.23676 type:complete len:344 (+) Transcript_8367:1702-2733(+)